MKIKGSYLEHHTERTLKLITLYVCILGKPQIVLERTERKEDGRFWFTMTVTAIPEPIFIQWSMNKNNEKASELLNINDDEYKGTTDTFPHPVLVVKSSKFGKYKFQIEVKNFIGNSTFIIQGKKKHYVSLYSQLIF